MGFHHSKEPIMIHSRDITTEAEAAVLEHADRLAAIIGKHWHPTNSTARDDVMLLVADPLRQRLEADGDPECDRKYLHFFPLLDDPEKNYYHDGENYWRVCRFIPESMSMSELTPKAARYAGAAFGQFEEILSVIPEGRLG